MKTREKLDKFAEFRAAPDAIRLKKQELIDRILTPEIKVQIAEIDAEFSGPLALAESQAAALEAEIKAEVLQVGVSVKGTFYQAVYARGRVSWDSKMLDGMILLLPQLAQARKEGEPSISLRKI